MNVFYFLCLSVSGYLGSRMLMQGGGEGGGRGSGGSSNYFGLLKGLLALPHSLTFNWDSGRVSSQFLVVSFEST